MTACLGIFSQVCIQVASQGKVRDLHTVRAYRFFYPPYVEIPPRPPCLCYCSLYACGPACPPRCPAAGVPSIYYYDYTSQHKAVQTVGVFHGHGHGLCASSAMVNWSLSFMACVQALAMLALQCPHALQLAHPHELLILHSHAPPSPPPLPPRCLHSAAAHTGPLP